MTAVAIAIGCYGNTFLFQYIVNGSGKKSVENFIGIYVAMKLRRFA